MHGIIFNQLYKFIRTKYGSPTLSKIQGEAGIGFKFYDATKAHPDSELMALVQATHTTLGEDVDVILDAFGKYIAKGLLVTYGSFIKPEWGFMDFLENVESTMHRAVRMSNPEATPPELAIERKDENDIVITYNSPRKLIVLGIGIIEAIAEHYQESVIIKRKDIEGGSKLYVTRISKGATVSSV